MTRFGHQPLSITIRDLDFGFAFPDMVQKGMTIYHTQLVSRHLMGTPNDVVHAEPIKVANGHGSIVYAGKVIAFASYGYYDEAYFAWETEAAASCVVARATRMFDDWSLGRQVAECSKERELLLPEDVREIMYQLSQQH